MLAAASTHNELEHTNFEVDFEMVCNIEITITNCWRSLVGVVFLIYIYIYIYIFFQMLAAHTTTFQSNTHNDILPNLVAAYIVEVCNIEKHYAYLWFANRTYILI